MIPTMNSTSVPRAYYGDHRGDSTLDAVGTVSLRAPIPVLSTYMSTFIACLIHVLKHRPRFNIEF